MITNLRNRKRVLIRDRKIRLNCHGTVNEQAHRFILRQRLDNRRFQRWDCQRWHSIDNFARYTEPLTARRQYFHIGTGVHKYIGESSTGINQMLAVVEQE